MTKQKIWGRCGWFPEATWRSSRTDRPHWPQNSSSQFFPGEGTCFGMAGQSSGGRVFSSTFENKKKKKDSCAANKDRFALRTCVETNCVHEGRKRGSKVEEGKKKKRSRRRRSFDELVGSLVGVVDAHFVHVRLKRKKIKVDKLFFSSLFIWRECINNSNNYS